jgi:hypothetical protein
MVTEPHGTFFEVQMQRNLSSDLRRVWGCQLSFMAFALAGFVPLALVYPFINRISAIYLASGLFDIALAFAANWYRRTVPTKALRRSIAAWLVIVASSGAAMFFVLWVGAAFGI